jgi:hypothetical protein
MTDTDSETLTQHFTSRALTVSEQTVTCQTHSSNKRLYMGMYADIHVYAYAHACNIYVHHTCIFIYCISEWLLVGAWHSDKSNEYNCETNLGSDLMESYSKRT